jgi:hypothetical protein
MDRNLAVEAFRNLVIQKGVLKSTETGLLDLICSDLGTVDHFWVNYLEQPKGWEEQTRRMAYSTQERNDALSHDLCILAIYCVYIWSIRQNHGIRYARNSQRVWAFNVFRRLDQTERWMVTVSAWSHTVDRSCSSRDGIVINGAKTKDVGALLKKRSIH